MNINETSKKVLTKLIDGSLGLQSYLAEYYGETDFSSYDENTINEVFGKAINFVLDELVQLGIYAVDIDPFTDLALINCISVLRSTFDTQRFYEFVSQSDTIHKALDALLNSGSVSDDLLLSEIIHTYSELIPISVDWKLMDKHRYIFINDGLFVRHITTIYEASNKSLNTRTIEDLLPKFVDVLTHHISKIRDIISVLTKSDKIPLSIEDFELSLYDSDLITMPPEDMQLYIEAFRTNTDYSGIESFTKHREKNDHHFRFYHYNNIKILTEKRMVLLVAEHLDISLTIEENKQKLVTLANTTKILDEHVETMKSYIDIYFELVDS